MDRERKSQVRWQESEQLGPYRLQEQVPQSESGQGELYRATHETSGATALVLKPTTDDSHPLTDWRVRCVSSASPSYLALEVEHSPWSVPPDEHSAEALVCVFEDVQGGVRRMARAFSAPRKPRLWWGLGLASAGVAAVCALVFALVRPALVSQPPGGPDEPVASTEPTRMKQEVPTNTHVPLTGNSLFIDPPDGGPSTLAHPFPSKPYKGQRRPPCKPRVEVEIKGGCWVPHELKAPCPEDLYEYEGKCYTVSMQPQPVPQSLGR